MIKIIRELPNISSSHAASATGQENTQVLSRLTTPPNATPQSIKAAEIYHRLLSYEACYSHLPSPKVDDPASKAEQDGVPNSGPGVEEPKDPSGKPKKPKNVFEAINMYGHDEDFDPEANEPTEPELEHEFFFLPTDAPAGSEEKIAILRMRVELGQPLHHRYDRVDYAGLTGAIRPRE